LPFFYKNLNQISAHNFGKNFNQADFGFTFFTFTTKEKP